MVYSASSALALKKFGSGYFFLKKQSVFSLLGLAGLYCGYKLPYRFLKKLTYPALLCAFILLVLVVIPGIGFKAGGATRWIRLGVISFQPSEFARFAMILYLAYSLTKKQNLIKDLSIGFVPHVIVLFVFTLLIAIQPDFGSIVILILITWIMMFVGGVKIAHLTITTLPVIPILIWYMMKAEYRVKRIMTFLDPFKYSSDEGYQIVHSLMAFGTGGIGGTGVGSGYQKLFYLPEPHTDFIFSVIGEEFGLIGVLFIIMLFLVIIWRGISIARSAKENFGTFLAIGIVTSLSVQVLINMGVVLGLLPAKGLALPFLSYGGTSLLINMTSIGILMNIGEDKKSE
ncbi:MAG: putative lipid II flippase FtsW [Desulfobacterales bacterium]|nr:putative lipid II flippase FtsW [Desulfobacterales bacterium]MCP4160353.1 putative lipid II flippase FtsW [Deltaproteobacteria bacterium]